MGLSVIVVVFFEVVVVQRRDRSPQGLGHRLDRWFFAGEESVLVSGLANKHAQAGNDWATDRFGLSNQQCLFGVVHGVEDQGALIEVFFAKRRDIHLGKHTDGGAIDQDAWLHAVAFLPGNGAPSEFSC